MNREDSRAAISLVEVLVAAAILACGAASVFWTLASTREQWLRQDVAVVARLLASSVTESAVHRARNQDNRYFTVTTTPNELARRAAAGLWKAPFLALAQPKTPVLTRDGVANPYFTGNGAPALPQPFDPDERRLWERFSYEVRVTFDIRELPGQVAVPLDSNGDGFPETDLARIEVEIYVIPPDGGDERSAAKLTTLVAAHDKSPGAQALAEP